MTIATAELDTVINRRDNGLTMEAIMTRDQRTTSHRVIERRRTAKEITSLYCQKLFGTKIECKKPMTTTKTLKIRESLLTPITTKTETTTTTTTDPSKVICRTIMRNHETEMENECSSRDTCTMECDCRNYSIGNDRQGCCREIMKNGTTTWTTHNKQSTTWLRLGGLLVTLLVVSVQSAPTKMTLEDRRLSSSPKWVNPCGLAADDINSDEFIQISDTQLLAQVVLQAKNALAHAQLFRDDYIKRIFSTNYEDLHSTWKQHHYDWLPGRNEIPKELGEPLDQDYLAKLEVRMLDTALLDAYEYMQRYAVGLEQIVWDQEDHRLEFRNQFKDTEYQLRTVLCELQEALVERGVTLRPDVTRDAMTSEYRTASADATNRNLRDWLIFRDYMNGLEYVVQVFQHLLDSLKS